MIRGRNFRRQSFGTNSKKRLVVECLSPSDDADGDGGSKRILCVPRVLA